MGRQPPQFELNWCLSRSWCGHLIVHVVKGSDDVGDVDGDVDGDWIGVGTGRELRRGIFTRIRHFLNAFHFVYIFPTPAYVLNVRSPTECCIDVNWTMGNEMSLDAMCRNAHKTYINLTQPSFGVQLRPKFGGGIGMKKTLQCKKMSTYYF